MAKGLKDRVDERLRELGINPFEAARRMGEGTGRDFVNDILLGRKKTVRGDNLDRLARALECEPSFLMSDYDTGPGSPPLVRIIGNVGANPDGEVLYATGDQGWDMAPIPPGGTLRSVALAVKGHSMRGLADNGALIYFEDQRTPPTPDMLGHVVVVETDQDEVLVKRLLKGSHRGVFDLESLVGERKEDVRLRWAAHIISIVPPYQAARIIRRAGEAA